MDATLTLQATPKGPGEFGLVNTADFGKPQYWPAEVWLTNSEMIIAKLPLTAPSPQLREVPRVRVRAGREITPRDHYEASLNMIHAVAA